LPLPCRADGCTAWKPRLSCDAHSPAASRRLLRPAPRLASKSRHHDSSSKGHHKCAVWCTSPQLSLWTPASLTHTHIHQHNLAGRVDSWFISRDSTIPLVSLCVHSDVPTIPLVSLCVHRDARSHKTPMPSRLSATQLLAFADHINWRGSATQKLRLFTSFGGWLSSNRCSAPSSCSLDPEA